MYAYISWYLNVDFKIITGINKILRKSFSRRFESALTEKNVKLNVRPDPINKRTEIMVLFLCLKSRQFYSISIEKF